MTNRDESIQGLRQLADWLTLNPTIPAPSRQLLFISLDTNRDVLALAELLDTDVTVDPEGNCSTELQFGTLTYRAYSYTDFDAHLEAANARSAQRYAERHNLTLTPKEIAA